MGAKKDYSKLPKRYNRKSKLDAAVKSVRTLIKWKSIIYALRRGKSSPSDPFTEEILNDCLNIFKKSENRELRRLTGLAKDLLLFSDLGSVWVQKHGWILNISDTITFKRDISYSWRWGIYHVGQRGPFLTHPHETLLSIREIFSEYSSRLNNLFITSL